MFDVSWNDPTRETVGQRKSRKESLVNGVSRGSSIRSSGSSNSKASKSSDSAPPPPSRHLFGGFGLFGSKKGNLARTNSQSNILSSLTPEERAAKGTSNYIPPQDSASTIKAVPPNAVVRSSTETELPSDG